MSQNKQNIDISGNIVRIPLESVIEIVRIATGKSRAGVEKCLSEIQNFHAYKEGDGIKAAMSAKYLTEEAENLEKSMKLLYALEAAKDREILEITR